MTEKRLLKNIGEIADGLGIQVYAVGGYVRDKIFLKESVKDIDFVVVGDGPAFAKKIAGQMKAINIVIFKRFKTARMTIEDYSLEFVSARSERYAEDSRNPKVEQSDLESDLKRRDFTINAMAMSLNRSDYGTIIDPYEGASDISKHIIRTPLDPEETFKDDPLRIMRAIRFATKLNFDIESETFAALSRMGHRLDIISQERITEEIMQILKTRTPSKGFYLLDEAGILPIVFPEISEMKGVDQRNDYHHKDVFIHTLKVVDNVAAVSDKLALRFVALVHDIAKPATKKFIDGIGWTFHGHDEIGARMLKGLFRRLKLPNEMLKYTEKLVRLHLRPINLSQEDVTDSAIRRLLVAAGENIDDLLTLCRADITSGNPKRVKRHLKNFDHVAQRLQEVEEKDAMKAFQSPVRGDEIMKLCELRPGPIVGILKSMIEEAILDGRIENEHEAAYDYLMTIKDEVLAKRNEQ
ncbi:MAG: HD domain-containing protein [candidate division KSB1 bacterium]|jgi:putative nucleotidyltransferase with HDIG domain|nr:HD domain-containing protein [candidate division KSB1 bacterium]